MSTNLKYTGINDKDGKKIYDGDVVHWTCLDDGAKVVRWIGDGDDCDWAADKFNSQPDSWLDSTCIRLGNIYEFPLISEVEWNRKITP